MVSRPAFFACGVISSSGLSTVVEVSWWTTASAFASGWASIASRTTLPVMGLPSSTRGETIFNCSPSATVMSRLAKKPLLGMMIVSPGSVTLAMEASRAIVPGPAIMRISFCVRKSRFSISCVSVYS